MALCMDLGFEKGIVEGSIKNIIVRDKVYGFCFKVRLNYYRGLFLSCIDKFRVTVDGVRIDKKDLVFKINEKELSALQLNENISEFWDVLDPAEIIIRKPEGLTAGSHEIDLELILRSPYLPLPGGKEEHNYVPILNSGKSTVVIREGVA